MEVTGNLTAQEPPTFVGSVSDPEAQIGVVNGPGTIADSLGPRDNLDVFGFSTNDAVEIEWTTFFPGRREDARSFTESYEAGEHTAGFEIGSQYPESTAYRISYDIVGRTVDDAIDDNLASILGKAANFQEVKFEALAKRVDTPEEAERFLRKTANKLGLVGDVIGIANRVDAIQAAAREGGPDALQEQAFVELVDLSVEASFATGSGAVAGLLSPPSAPVTAPLAGFGGSLVYSFTLRDEVRQGAREKWNELPGVGDEDPLQAAVAARPAQGIEQLPGLVEFDADWYLDTFPGAREAIQSGEVPSAYAYFITVGVDQGHRPNPDAEPLRSEDLAHNAPDELADQLRFRTAARSLELGEMVGDSLSAPELNVLARISHERSCIGA